MSELLRRGLIAALAPPGVPNCDIVVTDAIGQRLCAVQVKTRNNAGRDRGWHMSKKHESLTSPSPSSPRLWRKCIRCGWIIPVRRVSSVTTATCGACRRAILIPEQMTIATVGSTNIGKLGIS